MILNGYPDWKFCSKCGLALRRDPAPGYDAGTGEQNVYLRCPSEICGHVGFEHDYDRFVWRKFNWVCKCGAVRPRLAYD